MPPAVLKALKPKAPKPYFLRESLVDDLHSLREAKVVDEEKRQVEVVILSAGKGNPRDKHYYTPEAIENAAEIFEGKPAFADHASASEESDRPERSVRDIVGYYENVRPEGPALKALLCVIPGPSYQWAWDLVKESLVYAQKFPGQNLAGISINARGDTEPMMIEGEEWKAVKRIIEAKSADIVTLPARGGRFVAMKESQGGDQMNVQDILKAMKTKASEMEAVGNVPMAKDFSRMLDQALTAAGTADTPPAASPATDELPVIADEGEEGQLIHLPEEYAQMACKQAAERYAKAAEQSGVEVAGEAEESKAKRVKQSEGYKRMAEKFGKMADEAEAARKAKQSEGEEAAKKEADAKKAEDEKKKAEEAEAKKQTESLRAKVDEYESRDLLRESGLPEPMYDLMLQAMKGKMMEEKAQIVEGKKKEMSGLLMEGLRDTFHNPAKSPANNGSGQDGASLLRKSGLIK